MASAPNSSSWAGRKEGARHTSLQYLDDRGRSCIGGEKKPKFNKHKTTVHDGRLQGNDNYGKRILSITEEENRSHRKETNYKTIIKEEK